MRNEKSIRVGIWSYDHSAYLYRYSGELKKILYNMSKEGKSVVLVSPMDGEIHEMAVGLSRLMGLRYDIWLPSKPSLYARGFNDMKYAIFNRVLLGARGYRVVPPCMETVAISNKLDRLILLMDGKIHIADIFSDRDKTGRENE